jgi:hypothetical protein
MNQYSNKQQWAIVLFMGLPLIYILILGALDYETEPAICIPMILSFLIPLYLYTVENIQIRVQRWWNKMVCKIKGHNLGSPSYESATPSNCLKLTKCRRCGFHVSERIPHEVPDDQIYFQPSYARERAGIYYQAEYCSPGHGERKGSHKNETSYCQRMGVCQNCKEPIKLEAQEHEESQYAEGCETLARCSKCNNIRVLESHHQNECLSSDVLHREYESMSDTYIIHSHVTYRCKICGKKTYEFETHE